MNEIYEVNITYSAFVLADDHEHAEEVAREEASEIVSDIWSPDIEVVANIRSRKELEAYGGLKDVEYDLTQIPYGDTKKTIGEILEALEEEDVVPVRCRGTIDMFNPAPVVAMSEPPSPPNFRLLLARKHAQAGDDWQWCRMEYIDNGPFAGALVEGAVPNIDAEGAARWVGVPLEKVFIRNDEVRAAELAYEAETGKCFECAGSGKRNSGWHHEHGNQYCDCERCGATGKAVPNV